MNRIKKIIEALRVLSRTPSLTIKAAADNVLTVAGGDGRGNYTPASDNDFTLVRNLLLAVVAIAEDMEKEKPAKAAAESEAAK